MNGNQIAANLIELWCKSAAILVIGFLVIHGLRTFAPAFRHRIWMWVLTALIGLPLLMMLFPRWELIPAWWRTPELSSVAFEWGGGEPLPVAAASEAISIPAAAPSFWAGFTWQVSIIAAWGAGAFWLTARSVMGGIWLARLRRTGDDAACSKPIQNRVDRIRRNRGLERQVGVIVSDRISAPFTWGWMRPRIGLPREALSWSRDALEMVLLHELEHVRRRDALAMVASRVVLILNWLNPLAWLALRHAENCREEACDARVLAAGHRPANYADLLFRQARSVPAPFKSWATAVAETGTLERRVKMILNTDTNPESLRPARTVSWLVGAPLLLLGLAIGIAGLTEPGIAEEKKAEAATHRISLRNPGAGNPPGVIIELNGKPIDLKELNRALSDGGDSSSVGISAEESIPYAEVIEIMNVVGKAGITSVKFASPGAGPESQAGEAASENALTKKLKSIVIPKVEFVNTPLQDGIDFIVSRSGELDPEKKKINVIFKGPAEMKQRVLNLQLSNAPLAEALQHSAKLASARLEVDEHAVLILDRKAGDPEKPSPLADRAADAAVSGKLESIIVREIDFVDTPVLDGLAFLRQRAGELDPDSDSGRKGVNIVVDVSEDSGIDLKAVKITLRLSEIPLGEALKYTCTLGGLKSEVRNGAVVILPE